MPPRRGPSHGYPHSWRCPWHEKFMPSLRHRSIDSLSPREISDTCSGTLVCPCVALILMWKSQSKKRPKVSATGATQMLKRPFELAIRKLKNFRGRQSKGFTRLNSMYCPRTVRSSCRRIRDIFFDVFTAQLPWLKLRWDTSRISVATVDSSASSRQPRKHRRKSYFQTRFCWRIWHPGCSS